MRSLLSLVFIAIFILNTIAVVRVNFPKSWTHVLTVVLQELFHEDHQNWLHRWNKFFFVYGRVSGSDALWNMFATNSSTRWSYEVRTREGDSLYDARLTPFASFDPLVQVKRFRYDRIVHQSYTDEDRRTRFLRLFCSPRTELQLIYHSLQLMRSPHEWKEYIWSKITCP